MRGSVGGGRGDLHVSGCFWICSFLAPLLAWSPRSAGSFRWQMQSNPRGGPERRPHTILGNSIRVFLCLPPPPSQPRQHSRCVHTCTCLQARKLAGPLQRVTESLGPSQLTCDHRQPGRGTRSSLPQILPARRPPKSLLPNRSPQNRPNKAQTAAQTF